MKISIITATYNREDTIADTMRSVLSQTHKDIEYIIVDGASTDGTMDIVKSFEPLFEGKLQYVSEKDGGIYDAMNKGIRMATGDVVGILNSDDYFTTPNVLETIVRQFESDGNLDAVYGEIHYIKGNDAGRVIRYGGTRYFRPWMVRYGFIPAHPTFYAKLELYREFGLFRTDLRIAADFELMTRFIYCKRIRTRYIPMDMVTMRRGGLSTANIPNRLEGLREIVRSCRDNGIHSNLMFVTGKYFYKLFGKRLT